MKFLAESKMVKQHLPLLGNQMSKLTIEDYMSITKNFNIQEMKEGLRDADQIDGS